jgi:protein-tyrosine phosphatase
LTPSAESPTISLTKGPGARMKIIEIKDIERKDIPLHYRNEYTGKLVYVNTGNQHSEKRLEFTVERSPVGTPTISVQILDDIDYPLVPAIRSVKSHILQLDKEGKLL